MKTKFGPRASGPRSADETDNDTSIEGCLGRNCGGLGSKRPSSVNGVSFRPSPVQNASSSDARGVSAMRRTEHHATMCHAGCRYVVPRRRPTATMLTASAATGIDI